MGGGESKDAKSESIISKYFHSSHLYEQFAWAAVISIYLSVIIISLGQLARYTFADEPQTASFYASVVSGVATIGLVLITLWYAIQTRRMATEMERSREDEIRHREEEHQFELKKLRKALLREIQAVEDIDEIAENYDASYSLYTRLVPSTIYENNSKDIGLLTSDEVETIVDYYTIVDLLNDHLSVQRKMDTKIDRSVFEQVYYALSFSWLLLRGERQKRTQDTRSRINQLVTARNRAVSELKDNLED